MSHAIRQLALCVMILAFVATVFAYTTDQASNGKDLYVKYCAVCHGANGQGGTVPDEFGQLKGLKAPPLVGPGRLPGMETVGQVYDFASQNMPANKPGSLPGRPGGYPPGPPQIRTCPIKAYGSSSMTLLPRRLIWHGI
ncbi:MAG: c-type cytochrome, partial [Syntrophorhabdales bacterium]